MYIYLAILFYQSNILKVFKLYFYQIDVWAHLKQVHINISVKVVCNLLLSVWSQRNCILNSFYHCYTIAALVDESLDSS